MGALHPLAKARGLAQISQGELANRSGVDVSTIRDIESGRTRRPRPQTLARLARSLGVELEDLFLEEVAS